MFGCVGVDMDVGLGVEIGDMYRYVLVLVRAGVSRCSTRDEYMCSYRTWFRRGCVDMVLISTGVGVAIVVGVGLYMDTMSVDKT